MNTRKQIVRGLRQLVLSWAVLGALALALASHGAAANGAEEATANAAAQRAESDFIETRNLIGILRDGGLVMFPLFGCSLVLVAVVFERTICLRRGRVAPGPFVKRFLHQLREGELDPQTALGLCEDNGSPVAQVFGAAVRKWGRPGVEVEQAILDTGERKANELRRYLRVLNGLSTVTPLLGLLGTVMGIIRSFNAIAGAAAMGRPEALAHGIAEALITTATGLAIAIPALVAYLFFLGRVDQLIMHIDALGQEIVNIISAEGSRPSGRVKATRAARDAA
ncbi:MAG: MotA/TolQ/ExbB proton channel family protein [Pirellulales bacterium]|nr:MotA/TolQ/ExbB proton channel family protein [Pirellulales bacterium]